MSKRTSTGIVSRQPAKHSPYVLLADDQEDVRSALELLATCELDMTVVASVAAAADILPWAEAWQPDLALIDWGLLRIEPSRMLGALRALCEKMRVVALCCSPEECREAQGCCVDAVVDKGSFPDVLLAAIRGLFPAAAPSPAS